LELNNKPLVSVVVTCYNHEKYIEECLLSILKQTYQNIELIVIDDGSKDNSLNIIKDLAVQYTFNYQHQNNQGVCVALNHGLSLATGKYICCCDSDDKFALDKITKQVDFLEQNIQYKLCYTNKTFFDDQQKTYVENPGKRRSGWIFEALITDEFSMPFSSHMMYRTIYNEVGLYDPKIKIQDWDMFLRITKKYKVGFLNENLLFYRLHDTNLHAQGDTMYTVKYTVLEKWKDDPIYTQARMKLDLHYFNDFAKIDKKRALQMLPTILKYKSTKMFKGLRRLLFKW